MKNTISLIAVFAAVLLIIFPTSALGFNIFLFDADPQRCAEMHPDELNVKMILEYTQMLYTVIHLMSRREDWLAIWRGICERIGVTPLVTVSPSKKEKAEGGNMAARELVQPYGKTHVKHPCVLWLLESMANVRWVHTLAIECCREFSSRSRHTKAALKMSEERRERGKKHKCEPHLLAIAELLKREDVWPRTFFQSDDMTRPLLAMPDPVREKHGSFILLPNEGEGREGQIVCRSHSIAEAVAAYREFAVSCKTYASYTRGRAPPAWFRTDRFWSPEHRSAVTALRKRKDQVLTRILRKGTWGVGKRKVTLKRDQIRDFSLKISRATSEIEMNGYMLKMEME